MSVLAKIFHRKSEEVLAAKAKVSPTEIEKLAASSPEPRGFRKALAESPRKVSLIAEVKKASPSKGLIRPNFDAAVIARTYEEAGVTALSVLTDEHYFQGSAQNLILAKANTALPCLRKDFIAEPYQAYEARAWGADAVLLIVAGLQDEALHDLHELATQKLGMDVLVEVHTEEELERAKRLNPSLIGVNNRDLADFKTDLNISRNLLPLMPDGAVKVSESALETFADIELVSEWGARTVLIGTTFCAAEDIGQKVKEVMHW